MFYKVLLYTGAIEYWYFTNCKFYTKILQTGKSSLWFYSFLVMLPESEFIMQTKSVQNKVPQ